ncbi:MAG TPA: ribosome small subunit-dependent GTPase A, partial [Patescibacteria group bacterium]|nr:ribosome small subunit-dependent GTPase A [Patescibacteria group bacterium]
MENLGWDDFFESKKAELGFDDFAAARVTAEFRGGFKVKPASSAGRNEKGELAAKITGKQMFKAKSREDYPAVGDWVMIEELDDNQAVIKTILPRKSIIKRRFGDKNR